MTESYPTDHPEDNVKKIIPWLRDNPVYDVLEQRRREAMEILQDILQLETGLIEDLPDDIKEIIKIPDSRVLLSDV